MVAQALAARLREPGLLSEILRYGEISAGASRPLIDRIAVIAEQLDQPGLERSQDLLRAMVTRRRTHGNRTAGGSAVRPASRRYPMPIQST